MPLDPKAVAATDQEFQSKHGDLNGRSLTMDPADKDLRREWLALYKKNSGDKPPAAKQKPDDPVAHCPPPLTKSIKGKFIETTVKCGDAGHLEATGTNLAFGATGSFSIYRTRDMQALDSASGPMDVDGLEWKPKRPADQKKDDKYQFDVSADGVNAVSSNQFQFFEYPNYGPENKTWRIRGWSANFDIGFAKDVVTVTIKIKLTNRAGTKPGDGDPMPDLEKDVAGAYRPVSDADKASMKADIEGKLSEQVNLFRTNCVFGDACTCAKPVRIVVQFVESGQHHDVNLFLGSGRANCLNWTRVKTRDNSWAHETGHLLGWFDEYPAARGGTLGSAPRWNEDKPTHIMGSGLIVPPEYAWDFRDWLTGKSGEPWKAK